MVSMEKFYIAAKVTGLAARKIREEISEEGDSWVEFARGETPDGVTFKVLVRYYFAGEVGSLKEDMLALGVRFRSTNKRKLASLYNKVNAQKNEHWAIREPHEEDNTYLFPVAIFAGDLRDNCKELYDFLQDSEFKFKLLNEQERLTHIMEKLKMA